MASIKFELELDKNLNGYIKYKCPQCSRSHKLRLKTLKPGSENLCSCGYVVEFAGDDLRGVQRGLDDLRKTFKKIGK